MGQYSPSTTTIPGGHGAEGAALGLGVAASSTAALAKSGASVRGAFAWPEEIVGFSGAIRGFEPQAPQRATPIAAIIVAAARRAGLDFFGCTDA
jgi:hypothetical protein